MRRRVFRALPFFLTFIWPLAAVAQSDPEGRNVRGLVPVFAILVLGLGVLVLAVWLLVRYAITLRHAAKGTDERLEQAAREAEASLRGSRNEG